MMGPQKEELSDYLLTRRMFLGVGVVTSRLRWNSIPSFPSQYDEEVSREAVEQQLGIRLITIRDWYQETGREFPEDSAQLKDVPREWDADRLNLLLRLSSLLPPHFRDPHPSGKKLDLILSNTNHCNDTDPGVPPHQINLDYLRFQPQSIRRALEGLTYELTHTVLPKTVTYLENEFNPNLPPTLKIESPWFPIVEEIMGGNFPQKAEEMWYKVSERRSTSSGGRRRFYEELLTGLKRTEDPYELISVFSQHHLSGRDFMYAMYGEFFTPDQLARLYRFTRDDIFRGVEYAYFPLN